MTKDEALKMAIAFMETLTIDTGIKTWNEKHRKEAINACKEALEQPAQEPVAWRDVVGNVTKHYEYNESGKGEPLYTHPAQPLSFETILDLEQKHTDLLVGGGKIFHFEEFARAIEAKHGIK
jgi:hypothetical protein